MARKKAADTGASVPTPPTSTPSAGLRERVIACVAAAINKPVDALQDTLNLTA